MELLEKEIFKFKVRQNSNWLTTLAFYTCIIFLIVTDKISNLKSIYIFILLYPTTVVIYTSLYFIYFKHSYKKNDKIYKIDYQIKDVTDNPFDEDYKKVISINENFNGVLEIESSEENKKPKIVNTIFNKKNEIEVFNYFKEKGYKVLKKEYLYKNYFKKLFCIRKDIRYSAERIEENDKSN